MWQLKPNVCAFSRSHCDSTGTACAQFQHSISNFLNRECNACSARADTEMEAEVEPSLETEQRLAQEEAARAEAERRREIELAAMAQVLISYSPSSCGSLVAAHTFLLHMFREAWRLGLLPFCIV